MSKVEELEKELLKVISGFCEENKDIKVICDSNYTSGRVTIKVIEN